MGHPTNPKTLFSLAMGLAALGTTACQGEPAGNTGDSICLSQGCDDGPAPPISGNAILDCWVTPADSPGSEQPFDVLDCRYEPPFGYPATLEGATVTGLSRGGDSFSGDIDASQAGQILSMAHIDPSTSYPFELQLDIRFGENDRSIPALEGLEQVTTKVMVDSAAQIASDRPASANIPFDLWEVNLLGRDESFSALSFGYALDVGGDELHPVAFKTRPLLFGRVESFYLPVDVNTFALDARIAFEDGEQATASITGPGNYVVRAGQLEIADEADLPQTNAGGSTLAECWFLTHEHGSEQMYCHTNAGRGLAAEGAMIEVLTVHGKSVRVPVSETPTLVATVSSNAFPVTASIVGQIDPGVIGLEALAGRSLRASAVIDGENLPRAFVSQELQAPFAVWDVTVDNQSEGFQGSLDAYVLELGYGMQDRFAALVEGAETPFVEEASRKTFSVASSIDSLEVRGNGFMLVGGQAKEIEFVLRPGTLLVGE